MIQPEHIHPMLVHFPIVLLLVAVVIDFWVLLRGGGSGFVQLPADSGIERPGSGCARRHRGRELR